MTEIIVYNWSKALAAFKSLQERTYLRYFIFKASFLDYDDDDDDVAASEKAESLKNALLTI